MYELQQRRRIPLLPILLAIVLLSPTFFMGFFADDFAHQIAFRGDFSNSPMQPWALYDFGTFGDWKSSGSPLMNFPWWASKDWKIRFLRPVSSLILWMQYSIFGAWPLGYHLTSLAMFLLLLVGIHRMYLQLGLTDSAAWRGVLLYSLYQGVVMPACWPANQNSMVVALFAVGCMRLLLARPLTAMRVTIAMVAGCAAMFAKESGSASMVLVIVLLSYFSRQSRGSTNNSELPKFTDKEQCLATIGIAFAILSLAVWASIIILEGYGTNSVFYATPWKDPSRFAARLLAIFTGGVASFFGPFPFDLLSVYPSAFPVVVLAGAIIGLPTVLWIGKRLPQKPAVAFLGLWMLLFAALQAGAPPSSRVLCVPAIGVMGLLGWFFDEQNLRKTSGALSKFESRVVSILWLSATVGSASAVFTQSVVLYNMASYVQEKVDSIEFGTETLAHRTVMILQSESQMEAFAIHSTFAFQAKAKSATLWSVQSGNRPLTWSRVDERTFDVETTGDPFLLYVFERVLLSDPPDVKIDDRWTTPAFDVEALKVIGGMPSKLRFYMRASLDDPSIVFLRTSERRYERVYAPAVGETIALPMPPRVGPPMP